MKDKEKYGFVYIWYDKKHKRYYIGCHWGTIEDGYICSSRWMKTSYKRRPKDFTRRILKRDIDRKVLLEEEYKWLQLIPDEHLGKKYYNLRNQHNGHWSTSTEKATTLKEKLSNISKELHKDPIYRAKFLEGRKKMPKQTKEQIEKRAISNTGNRRTEEEKEKTRETFSRGKNHGNYGKPLSDETKAKIGIKVSGERNGFFGKKHPEETMKRISEKSSKTMKGRMPKNIDIFKGSYWWNDGQVNKRSQDCPGKNWEKGMLSGKTE